MALYPPLPAAAVLGSKTYLHSALATPDAWRTRDWRKAVDYHATLLAPHLADGILSPTSRAVCLGAVQEALAMRELGVSTAVAVARKRSPPLAVAGNDRRLPFPDSSIDFVFAARALDSSKRPADLAAESARILKPDGHLVVLTTSAADAFSLRALQALLPSLRLLRSRQINAPDDSTLRELVFQKIQDSTDDPVNKCTIGDHKLQLLTHAEPLIQEEPRKPWITLKRNIKNIKYLPTLADISFKRNYVYVDVGARSYGSSIGSWFRKHYPKQNHTFQVFAIEADPAFHSEYAAKKAVTLLPYAAWVKNETLNFEINADPGKEDEAKANGRGMGRIRPMAGKKMSGEVRSVPAFDFAEWLKRTVSEQDYVVMKMDVEGTEFDLIPRLFDTGAICLIDELFLECHYNRWQKCCPAFEAFYDGSWHGVNSIRIRNGNLFVKFIYSGSTVEHNVDGDCLRLRSRRATCSDCSNVLKPGVDVCVQSSHTPEASSQGGTNASVLLRHDARLITIKKNHQEDKCLCLFVVILYKNQCPGNAEKVITDRRAEVVTINDIFLLQKLQPEVHEGSMKWSFSKDRLSLSKSRLISARFSSEITHLIVLSILRGMEFNIKLVEGQIVYQIIKGDQARWNLDSMAIPPGFGNTMEIISFQLRDEALRPTITNIPITHVKKNNITEDMRFTVKSEMDSELDRALDVEILYEHVDLRRSKRLKTQPDRFTSYDTPRFLSGYKKKEASSSPTKNVRGAVRCDSPVDDSKKEVESCCVEIPGNVTQKQTGVHSPMVDEKSNSPEGQHKNTTKGTTCSLPVKEKTSPPEGQHKNTTKRATCSLLKEKASSPEGQHDKTTKRTTCALPVKEKPSSPEGQHKNTMKRTTCSLPVKEDPSSVEIEEKSSKEQSAQEFHIPRTPAQNKEKHNHPPFSCKPKLFTSSGTLGVNCEPAFCQKVGRKRKRHMCEREYKQMIDQCIGNIESEMERDSMFNFDANMMNYVQHSYREEDFTWPPSADNQEVEEDELEELWKEMDYSLTTLALLEQKQVMAQSRINMLVDNFDGLRLDCLSLTDDYRCYYQKKEKFAESGSVNESTDYFGKVGGIPCHHECILDEELGLACRLCNVVCTEAKDIFPEMFKGNDYKDRPGCSNICLDDDMLDPSLLANLAPELSELKNSGSVWSAISDLDPKLLPHQRKALDFLWKNLAGSIQVEGMDNSNVSTGGCVIAHTPGSGKTLLLISFLVSYMKAHPRSRPLVLTPKAAIHTWKREFEKWGISLPLHVFHHANRSGKPLGAMDSKLRSLLNNFHRPTWTNMRLMDSLDKLFKWHAHPSVLLMTYSSFLGMTKQDSKVRNRYREFIAEVLMNNPGLLILDEGHNPRSNKSKLRKLLMKVKTEFRILLSGTAFQNNFEEYFNTLCLARPRFIGDIMSELVPERKRETVGRRAKHQEAVARRAFVEKVGQKIESDNKHIRSDGISLLNKLTRGFIDSFEGAKLINLPGIHVYTVFMKPTDIQEEMLAKVTMPKLGSSRFPLEVELLITIGSIHPWLIKTTKAVSTFFSPAEVKKVERYKRDFAAGCKAKFVIDLLHKSSFRGERVLIFCHNVSPITFLVKLIEMVFGWRLGEEVLVLQGDQELPVRSDVMDKFNGDSAGRRKVLIASTTACAEGISLTGASRLVMLDSEWNHSKTRQAIARAFRRGQERTVYVYLLVASGTWEEEKYNSNRRKAWMSKMVFLGRYVDDSSQNRVTDIDDEVLKELADEDHTGTFHMIVKQD
uniref:Uncharacterized protein n=1 Tax=Oryza meridionalis TaxID=40149 RepID=A0A0E0EGH0_9ORYZ